jgi:WD40 repeat protein
VQTHRLWHVRTGAPHGEPIRHTGIIQTAAFSPDGKRMVPAGSEGKAQLIDVAAGKAVCPPLAHPSMLMDAAFSPDSRALLTRTLQTARLWRTDTGEAIGEELRHPQAVAAAVFTWDSKLLVTGSVDGSVRLWDTRTSQPVGEPLTQAEPVSWIAAGTRGRLFLVGGQKGLVSLWELPSGVTDRVERLQREVQANTGLVLDPGGAALALDGPGWRRQWHAWQQEKEARRER